MKRAIILACAVCLIAAPISFAQTTPQQTPPSTSAPPATTPPPNAQPALPSEPTTPAPSETAAPASSPSAPQGCRTRKAAGEACACVSDTSRVGTSTAHADGHNVCVRPD